MRGNNRGDGKGTCWLRRATQHGVGEKHTNAGQLEHKGGFGKCWGFNFSVSVCWARQAPGTTDMGPCAGVPCNR